jgi:hypothetical protein
VLARILEASGIATVIVTMMPMWSVRLGAPRTLGVEHPYGQTMGAAGDRERQREVFDHALRVLERAQGPDHIEHSDYRWPDERAGRKEWHPPEPSPIAQLLTQQAAAEP